MINDKLYTIKKKGWSPCHKYPWSSGCLNIIPLFDDVHNIVPYFVSWQLLKNNTQTLCESFYENGK